MQDQDFRLVFEAASRALLLLAPDTPRFTVLAASNAFVRETHMARETTIGRGLFDIFTHEDRDAASLRASLDQALASRSPVNLEAHRGMIAGLDNGKLEERFWNVRNTPVLGPDHEVRSIIHAVEDVTGAIKTSRSVPRTREELEREITERTEERDRIWQNSNELMGVFGFDGRRRAVNPAWTRVLGYDEVTLLETPFIEVTHPDDRPRLIEAVQALAKGERITEFEDRLRHADGSYRYISWTGVPGDGLFYAIGRDVTEQRQAEEALRQAQKMEAVGQLTGGVAHDFNNMLTIIRSSTDFLRRSDFSEERRRRYLDAIADTVQRAAKLTGQLLAFARRQSLKPEVFDVGERIRAVTDMLRALMGARVHIVAEIACERCAVEADMSQFETALVNMAVNARDAMPDGGMLTVRVEEVARIPGRARAVAPGGYAAISLTDTGSGIAADKLPHIFEPFFTTKQVGKGTGLGLSQVYGFAQQSGGDIAVRSEVGRGSAFTLYLPRIDPATTADEAPGEAARQPEGGRGRRVLLVEDDVDVGTFSAQVLQDLGYETTWAANADEALALLSDEAAFDVVFSDVVMPGMSGVELGHEIRRRHPHLPVLLTSGYSEALAEKGRHGFELLQKPYAPEELSHSLHRVMQTHGKSGGAARPA